MVVVAVACRGCIKSKGSGNDNGGCGGSGNKSGGDCGGSVRLVVAMVGGGNVFVLQGRKMCIER